MFLSVRLAKGWPSAVGMDMSMMQRRRLVREPEDVACEAEAGSIMWWEVCEEMTTDLEEAKEGLWI